MLIMIKREEEWMAIKISFDKESEFLWIKEIIDAGVLNGSHDRLTILKYLGVSMKQSVTYSPNDNYEDDTKEKREEYNKKFSQLNPRQAAAVIRAEMEDEK